MSGAQQVLVFQLSELRGIAEHAQQSKSWRKVDGVEAKSSLLLVKDQGVYIMSPGLPALMTSDGEKKMGQVAYAKDCNPYKDAGYYDTSRALVGGDDFVETFDCLPREVLGAIDAGKKELCIVCTAEQFSVHVR